MYRCALGFPCSFRWSCLLGALLALCLSDRTATALPTFPPIVDATYQFKPHGKLQSAGCTLCHTGQTDGQHLNPYGKDVQTALKHSGGKKLTATILHTLDARDSDGDGFSNLEELSADTLPGDAASKPLGMPHSVGVNQTVPKETSGKPETLVEQVRGLLFPKHAQHPILVHFPIALFIVSVFFDLLGFVRKDKNSALVGYFNLVVAGVTSIPAVITGLLAWWIAFDHAPLQGNLLYHLILALAFMIVVWAMIGVRVKGTRANVPNLGVLYTVLALIGVAVVSLTGHIGGILSGVN